MDNGTTFQTMGEYRDAASEVIDSLCPHNLKELVIAMAAVDPSLFQWALGNTSLGCDKPAGFLV